MKCCQKEQDTNYCSECGSKLMINLTDTLDLRTVIDAADEAFPRPKNMKEPGAHRAHEIRRSISHLRGMIGYNPKQTANDFDIIITAALKRAMSIPSGSDKKEITDAIGRYNKRTGGP